jgi:hypothetical protein
MARVHRPASLSVHGIATSRRARLAYGLALTTAFLIISVLFAAMGLYFSGAPNLF